MKFILVSSHPRSGTHFLINSILSTSDNFLFPQVRPSFLTLENLMLTHDQNILDLWLSEIKNANKLKKILIFKTHCTVDDIIYFIHNEKVFNKEAKLIKYIYNNSIILNIKRDKINTLKSWFSFSKSNMLLTVNSSSSRHKNLKFSDFIRLKNLHKINIYKSFDYDENLVRYLSFHHQNWNQVDGKILHIEYENLKDNFQICIKNILNYLIKNNLRHIDKNINNYKIKKIGQNKNNFFIKYFNKFISKKSYFFVYNKTEYNLSISKKDLSFIKSNCN